MPMQILRHPDYQEIEQFLLGRLGPPEHPAVVQVEEHLLACPACVNVAVDALVFALAIREALGNGSRG